MNLISACRGRRDVVWRWCWDSTRNHERDDRIVGHSHFVEDGSRIRALGLVFGVDGLADDATGRICIFLRVFVFGRRDAVGRRGDLGLERGGGD